MNYDLDNVLKEEDISCPNFFGEIIEWLGFAVMTLNPGSISFLIWTVCNLVPRSKAHQVEEVIMDMHINRLVDHLLGLLLTN